MRANLAAAGGGGRSGKVFKSMSLLDISLQGWV